MNQILFLELHSKYGMKNYSSVVICEECSQGKRERWTYQEAPTSTAVCEAPCFVGRTGLVGGLCVCVCGARTHARACLLLFWSGPAVTWLLWCAREVSVTCCSLHKLSLLFYFSSPFYAHTHTLIGLHLSCWLREVKEAEKTIIVELTTNNSN